MRDFAENGASSARSARRKRREGRSSSRSHRQEAEPLKLPPIAGASPPTGHRGDHHGATDRKRDARRKARRKAKRQREQLLQRFVEIRKTYNVVTSPRPASMGAGPASVRLPRASPNSTRLRASGSPVGRDSPAFRERRALLKRVKAFCRMLEERRQFSFAHAGGPHGATAADAVKHSDAAEASHDTPPEARAEASREDEAPGGEAKQQGPVEGEGDQGHEARANEGPSQPARTAESEAPSSPADPSIRQGGNGEEKDSGAGLDSGESGQVQAEGDAGTSEAKSGGEGKTEQAEASSSGAAEAAGDAAEDQSSTPPPGEDTPAAGGAEEGGEDSSSSPAHADPPSAEHKSGDSGDSGDSSALAGK